MFKIVSVYTGLMLATKVCAAIKEACGECILENIADDAVLGIIRKDGYISESSFQRVENMVKSAQLAEPDLILGTCSSIGGVFDELSKTSKVPLLRIDLPMAEKAVEVGNCVVVVGTNMSTIGPSCEIVERVAKEKGKEVKIRSCIVDQLFPILKAENKEKAIAYAADEIKKASGGECDVVMLAQASLTQFQDDLGEKLGAPVLASIPICAEYIRDHYFKK